MKYSEIVSVSKLSGLYHIHKQRTDGLIIKSLSEDKIIFAASRAHVFTPLENITIYTQDEPIELIKVMLKMKEYEATQAIPSAKAPNNDLKDFFGKIVPDYDTERVYVSDIQKIIKWYFLLKENDLIKESTTEDKDTAEVKTEKKETKKIEKKPSVMKEVKVETKPKAKTTKPTNRKSG